MPSTTRLKSRLPDAFVAVLIVLYSLVFLSVRHADKLPDVPTNTRGLDVEKAWADLHQITRRPHPYNSHENDLVRKYLLNRLQQLSQKYPFIQYTSDAATRINTTYIDPPHAAYFESLNIIVLIPGTESLLHSKTANGSGNGGVLYSAHIDSVASGVGATDDGVGVVCILGLVEFFAENRAKKSVVFNLNDGEEDGLNGAMAFFNHPWSTIPDTFVNFEGSGAGGRPIFFRSTSLLPLRAATSNQHAHANVLSGDAFEHRLLRSRTDFTVYSKSLPTPSHKDSVGTTPRKPMQGIDLAFYKHRSLYHTKYDAIPYIEGGKRALWAMMDAGRGVGWELANRRSDGHVEEANGEVKWGDGPVFFDLFNRYLIVFSRSTLLKLNLLALFVLPLLLSTFIRARRSFQYVSSLLADESQLDNPKLFRERMQSDSKHLDSIYSDILKALTVPEGRLFWKSLACSLGAQAVLVVAYAKLNPFVVYGRPYEVLASFFLLGILIPGLFGYYHHPSSSSLASSLSANVQPLTRLLLNAYILTYVFIIFGTVLLYKAGLGGIYFITIWGMATWMAASLEVFVGGFDIPGLEVIVVEDKEQDASGVKRKGGVNGGLGENGPSGSRVGSGEPRRSLRKQATIASALEVSSTSDHTTTVFANEEDASINPARNASVSPRKRGRPHKAKKQEVYVEVPSVESIRSDEGESSTSLTSSVSLSNAASDLPSLNTGMVPLSHEPTTSVADVTTGSQINHQPFSSIVFLVRIVQLVLTVVVPVTLMSHIAQLLVDGMSQTLADGSKGVVVYATLALFGALMAVPATPWILNACFDELPTTRTRVVAEKPTTSSKSKRLSTSTPTPSTSTIRSTKKKKSYSLLGAIPLGILAFTLHEITIKNLTVFPFDSHTPLKVFFQQRIEYPPLSLLAANVSSSTIHTLHLGSSTTHAVHLGSDVSVSGNGNPEDAPKELVDIDIPRITTLVVGVPKYIRRVVDSFPSSRGKEVRCADRVDRKGTVGCEWDVELGSEGVPGSGSGSRAGLRGGDDAPVGMRKGGGGVVGMRQGGDDVVGMRQEQWFDANVTRTGPRSARFEVSGVNTKNCRIYFEEGVVGYEVERVDASVVVEVSGEREREGGGRLNRTLTESDAIPGFKMPEDGVKLLVLWSRGWDAKWVVDVRWGEIAIGSVGSGEAKETEKEKMKTRRGRVACEWSEYDSARAGQVYELDRAGQGEIHKDGSSIPAFEEVVAFAPRWVSVSKLYHGMLEVGRGWEI